MIGFFQIISILLLLIFVPIATFAEEKKLDDRSCEKLGFTGLALCSDCNSLAEYVKDEELVSECKQCCIEDSDDPSTKVMYAGAILEVCSRKLIFYPEIESFIEDDRDEFPFVKVQSVYSSPPKLIMLDEQGNQKETIRIDNWKREHIQSFLREKVKKLLSTN